MDALTIIGIIGIIIGIVAGIVQIVDYLQKRREQRALTTPNIPLPAAAIPTDDSLAQLRQQLTTLFNESELRNLCFDLGVDYESLPARSKDGKARELIAHMQRNSRLPEMIKMGRQLRPQAPWPDFPPEATPDPFPKQVIPHNLPRRSPFVGREAEKAQVHEALLADGYLVSIEGIGGIGKSSLALHVAHECLQAGLDDHESRGIATFAGLIWVTAKDQELNLDGVLNTVARTLEYVGIAQQPLEEKLGAVQKLLRAKRCLLIMDNYETVTDTGVHQFLRELPEPSKALITTRIQNTPQAHIVSLKGMTQAEALALIRSDGQRLGLPAVARADETVLVRLYEATGGAPLALKWALGQIKQKGQSLDTVLMALHEARGTIFETMFARAWDLLSNDAQRVLLVMPIFATSADRLDIEAASAIQGSVMDEALGQLVEMTLVEATSDTEITSRRYSIHPLTRAYVHNQLLNHSPLEEESRLRLANYYISRSKKEWTWLSSSGDLWFEAEQPNILALLEWADQTQRWDIATAIFTPLLYFMRKQGYWQESIKYGYKALEAATKLGIPDKIGRYQEAIAWVLYNQGRYAEAQPILGSAIKNFLQLGKKKEAALTVISLAKIALAQADFSTATQHLNDAAELDQENGFVVQGLLATGGNIAYRQGNYVEAKALLERALEVTKGTDRRGSVGSRIRDLAYVALAQNQIEEAFKLFEESLTDSRQVQRTDNIAKAQLGLARVYGLRGEKKEATKLASEAKELFERLLMENELRETEQLLRALGES